MSDIVKLRTRAEIDEEAAAWIWRLDAGSLEPADQQAFDAWLRQDPRHRRALEELSRVWHELDGLSEAKRDEKIATFQTARLQRPLYARAWAVAAAAVLAVVAAGLLWLYVDRSHETQTLATAVGQQRSFTLPDGSVVLLNTNTIVETDLDRHQRTLFLRQGEAHFQVAHDRSRPFLVRAGDAIVRAVGTEFEVRLRTDQHVDVLVNEGRVEVQASAPVAPASSSGHTQGTRVAALRALSAGEALTTASTDYAVTSLSPARLSNELAWRQGAIVFDGEPLADAIAQVERYTDARIVVGDATTAALPVGGRFRTDDLEGFLEGLQTALPVSIRHGADGLVYIEPRR